VTNDDFYVNLYEESDIGGVIVAAEYLTFITTTGYVEVEVLYGVDNEVLGIIGLNFYTPTE
jgi:hypothetical protein